MKLRTALIALPFLLSHHRYDDETLRLRSTVGAQAFPYKPTFPQFMLGPLPYIGGKRALAKQIIAIFPEHTTYVEAFAGGAQVLFRKEPSRVEVLNDLDGDVVNFYRVCQQHYEELVRYLRYTLASRAWLDLLKVTDPSTITDIQRAARFYFLQKNSFAGLVRRHNFTARVVLPTNYNAERVPEWIENTHHRLANVQIPAPREEVHHQ